MQGQRYTNGVLTAIAALLGLHLVGQAMHHGSNLAPEASIAQAQPEQYRRDGASERPTAAGNDPTEGGLVSAAEQRKIIIMEIRSLAARLAAIESRMESGLNVNVMTMPAGAMGDDTQAEEAVTAAPQPTP